MLALPAFVDALHSLTLALLGRALAGIRIQLSLVGELLADVRDPVPLIGDAVSFVGDPLAPGQLALAQRNRILALIELSRAGIESAWRVGTVLGSDHGSTLTPRGPSIKGDRGKPIPGPVFSRDMVVLCCRRATS